MRQHYLECDCNASETRIVCMLVVVCSGHSEHRGGIGAQWVVGGVTKDEGSHVSPFKVSRVVASIMLSLRIVTFMRHQVWDGSGVVVIGRVVAGVVAAC